MYFSIEKSAELYNDLPNFSKELSKEIYSNVVFREK